MLLNGEYRRDVNHPSVVNEVEHDGVVTVGRDPLVIESWASIRPDSRRVT